jgi:hypothetical protein
VFIVSVEKINETFRFDFQRHAFLQFTTVQKLAGGAPLANWLGNEKRVSPEATILGIENSLTLGGKVETKQGTVWEQGKAQSW